MQMKGLVRDTVQEVLNALLDEEAAMLANAAVTDGGHDASPLDGPLAATL